jgi:hypothetical protein
VSVLPSIHLSAWNNFAPTGRILVKFYVWVFSKICREISSFIKTWQEWEELYMKTNVYFFIISRSVLLRMKNASEKSCRENQNTHFIAIIFFLENTVFYKIMHSIFYSQTGQRWKYDACALHAGYLSLKIHKQNKCFHQRTSILRCTYIACLVTALRSAKVYLVRLDSFPANLTRCAVYTYLEILTSVKRK